MKTLCRTIKPDEALNYNQQNLAYNESRKIAYLTIYPFTNCAPYDRADTIQQWNDLACKIFKAEHKIDIQIPDPVQKALTGGWFYSVSFYGDNGKFKITSTSRETFQHDHALESIKQAMIDVIKAINEIIDLAWMHNKMLECFPEFNTTIIGELKSDIKNILTDLKTLKDDIGQIKPFPEDESLATQFSLIEIQVGHLKEIAGKHIGEINRLKNKIDTPDIIRRKRPRR
jgi:hypothetical protein